MTFSGRDKADVCFGFEESLQTINEVFEKQGPFDGIFGFSQGAAFAALICSLKETKKFHHEFKFVVLVAGFISGSTKHDFVKKYKITIPSFHVFGESDAVIPKDMSEELLSLFIHADVLLHPGGHFVPTSGPSKQKFIEYFNKVINNHNVVV